MSGINTKVTSERANLVQQCILKKGLNKCNKKRVESSRKLTGSITQIYFLLTDLYLKVNTIIEA